MYISKNKIFSKPKFTTGFTLIELLMVISIITLLSSIIFSGVNTARAKSRDVVRLSDMKQIGVATEMFYEDKGMLPVDINALVSAGYLSAEPKDPKTGNSYNFKRGNSDKTVVVSGNYESDGSILAIAVGDTSNEVLCEEYFENFTGCSDGTIGGHIVGITSRRGNEEPEEIDPVPPIAGNNVPIQVIGILPPSGGDRVLTATTTGALYTTLQSDNVINPVFLMGSVITDVTTTITISEGATLEDIPSSVMVVGNGFDSYTLTYNNYSISPSYVFSVRAANGNIKSYTVSISTI